MLALNDEQQTERVTKFVDVILPVPIPKLFTYRVPFELNEHIEVGSRVIVPFGKKKILTGVIGKIHQAPPKEYEAKYIQELLDPIPMVNQIQIDLFHWIGSYYMCTIGEVLNVALPSGLKLSSQSKIQFNPDYNIEDHLQDLTDKELELIRAAQREKTLTYPEIEEILEIKNFNHIIKSLIHKQAIIIYEEVKERYSPKRVKKVRLTSDFINNRSKLEQLFTDLEKQPKQLDILLKFLQEVPVFKNPEFNEEGIDKQVFSKGDFSNSSLQTLIKNKILEEFEINVSRLAEWKIKGEATIDLSEEQSAVKKTILDLFAEKDIVLFHGVTGSGKTEIYIELIKEVLESGSQVLYLLPEIALTTQIVSRLRKIFGDKIGVYHSKFSDNERVEVWKGVAEGKISFVIGVRSSIFLPFDNLGMIIVDEEHENSYKQFDPAPRYHARDTAMVLAKKHQARVLLGSATPSIESYYHALSGKYGLVELKIRFGNAQLPQFILADTRTERKQKLMRGEFSSVLVEELEKTTSQKEQTIIFQNRRGYAPHITCDECAWIPKCDNCAVSLTYHMGKNELRCHYCGYNKRLPSSCPACGSAKLRTVGYGTEKLEEEVKLQVPEARVQRMDLDTTRKRYSYQNIIEEFEKGNIDILVGTQMVSKGLDFDQVRLVGIFDADRMIHFPDFRSFERTFQLITQVSGRAGRREKEGKVVIQTANIYQPLFKKIIENDYSSFYREEIQERKSFLYPPFVRLIKILVKHIEKEVANAAAEELAFRLKKELGKKRVLGPEEPVISKLRNLYMMQTLVKVEKGNISLVKVKEEIKRTSMEVENMPSFRKLNVVFDVDPY